MSVAISYSKDNDRFIRHSFLSLSPTSTTIYERTFDKLKNKYHVPCRTRQVVDFETGEVTEVQETIQPPKFNQHIGSLSDKARRQLNRSVYTLLGLVDENILLNGQGKEKITFATFTLPSAQIKSITPEAICYHATDKQIKSDCFNQLLTELRQTDKIKNYVWVSEKQLNGSIHFHVLFDNRIDYEWLRVRWNSLINKYGFVDRYQQKMQSFSFHQYKEMRLKEKNKPALSKIQKAWDFGLKTNWTQPNSTDIETLRKVDNVAAYISKYMSKSYSHSSNQQKEAIYQYTKGIDINQELAKQFYNIDGRIWQCSQSVSKARRCIVECEDTFLQAISYMTEKVKEIKIFSEDRFTTLLHKFNHIQKYAYEIYDVLIQNYKAHNYHDISNFIHGDYIDNSPRILSPLLVQTPISSIIPLPSQHTQTQLIFN